MKPKLYLLFLDFLPSLEDTKFLIWFFSYKSQLVSSPDNRFEIIPLESASDKK